MYLFFIVLSYKSKYFMWVHMKRISPLQNFRGFSLLKVSSSSRENNTYELTRTYIVIIFIISFWIANILKEIQFSETGKFHEQL